MSSNSADTAGEKREWLKQTEKSVDPVANIKIQNETNSESSHKFATETKNPGANDTNTNPGAGSQNTRPVRKSAPETKNPVADRKTEFSKLATGSTEKSVEKTYSSKFAEDPKHLEIIGSNRNKIIVDFSVFGDELRFDGEDVVISTAYYFQIRYNDIMVECRPTKNGYVCCE